MNWLPEINAAQMLQRKPRTLRAKAKARVWPITYTTVEGRSYQYSEQDIKKFLLSNSNNLSKPQS